MSCHRHESATPDPQKSVDPGLLACLGKDSTGLEIKNPLSPAAFSPCLPNPNPLNPSFSSSFSKLPRLNVFPVCRFEKKGGGGLDKMDAVFMGPTDGNTLFACSFHDVIDRFVFTLSRKMSPMRMLRHPIENRKNAEASVKPFTR